MARWTKICCAIDFSEMARLAMEEAAELAKDLGAELTLLYVHEPPPRVALDVLVTPADLQQMLSTELEESIASWTAEANLLTEGAVRFTVRIGHAAEEIPRFAREDGTDLLVLGTHGRTGLTHLVLGSVAERVLRQAPCPVLVVREKELSDAALVAEEAALYT